MGKTLQISRKDFKTNAAGHIRSLSESNPVIRIVSGENSRDILYLTRPKPEETFSNPTVLKNRNGNEDRNTMARAMNMAAAGTDIAVQAGAIIGVIRVSTLALG